MLLNPKGSGVPHEQQQHQLIKKLSREPHCANAQGDNGCGSGRVVLGSGTAKSSAQELTEFKFSRTSHKTAGMSSAVFTTRAY